MTSIGYDQKCKKNKDCSSNVCEMIYENEKPVGRYCLTNTKSKYTRKCVDSKDCRSGVCKKIYDKNGHFLVKKCIRAPKVDTDTAYNTLFGKERSNEYGLLNNNAIMLNLGEKGPIAEVIIKVISIISNLFQILIFNFDACHDARRKAEENDCKSNQIYTVWDGCEDRSGECNIMSELNTQGILYKIWRTIFNTIFNIPTGMNLGAPGLLWGGIAAKHTDECGDCKDAYGFDLWYLRTIITILFPPFGVLMAKGINGFFYILLSCVLTAMFYFPGLIYSFAVINASELDIEDINNIIKKNKINL